MKKHLIAVAVLTLIPSIASTAITTDKAVDAQGSAEATAAEASTTAGTTTTGTTTMVAVEGAEVVDLGQFTASDTTSLGAVTATVVASPGDRGRAEAAISGAFGRARAFAVEVPSLQEKLGALAKGERMELSPDAFNFMTKAKELAAQTHGWYDPTAPSPKGLFFKRDWRRIGLDADSRTVWLKADGMKFDLERLAAGYAADLIMEELAQSGFPNAMVEVGSVSSNRGHDIFTPWSVTIGFGEGPTGTGAYRAYRYNIKDVGAATVTPSGLGNDLIDAQNKKAVNAEGMRSITVFAHDSTTATAFSIAAYTLGPKHGLRFIESHPEMMCVVVNDGGELFASKNMNITNAPERTAVKQASTGGGPNDLKQKQREESMEQ